jgi:branched-chain amino acid transport system ATP-binding protein
MPLLEVQDLHVYYGNIHALRGVSLAVEEGEVVTLIGANGAGKSTTLNTISGLHRPREGQIRLRGEDLTMVPAHEIVERGVVQVPEGRRIFGRLNVIENLEMGAFTRTDAGRIRDDLERVLAMFPRLRERAGQVAGTLSGGEQQMLAIGRALMARPRVLLMDEPSMGLAPVLVEQIFDVIQEINQRGTTILLVEQNAYMALQVAHRGYVMETGTIVLSGPASDLQTNPEVKKAYLGG